MEVNCEGCAGCCLDWRPLADVRDHERRGPRTPIDDVYNLVPLTRDDARSLLEAGLGDAMTPRLWIADDGIEIDGRTLATIDGNPAFFLGLRKPSKPVAPFDTSPRWLRTCAFLDPTTLQCRIHDTDLYPQECADYPAHNLRLEVESECERVEAAFGGTRLQDASIPDDLSEFLGPHALGWKVFTYPWPAELAGVIDRIAARELTQADRAAFVATAVASAPGTTTISDDVYESAYAEAIAADSWVGTAASAWEDHATETAPDPELAIEMEEANGAPETPGW